MKVGRRCKNNLAIQETVPLKSSDYFHRELGCMENVPREITTNATNVVERKVKGLSW